MKKLIIGISLLLVAVLFLSFSSRITDSVYDKFFSDDSSLNSGNNSGDNSGDSSGNNSGNNSGTGSEGNSGGENSGDSGDSGGSSTEIMCSYKKTSLFYVNNRVDVSSEVKDGSYYYYKVYGNEFYVKYPEPLSSELIYTVSVDSNAYSIASSPVPEDDTFSILFEYDFLSSDVMDFEYCFYDGGIVLHEERSFVPLASFSYDSTNYYTLLDFDGVIYVILTMKPLSITQGYKIYSGSALYSVAHWRDGPIDWSYADVEETGYYV